MPRLDVLIPTIGRRSLELAIMSACHQTYSNLRVVVCADGEQKDARRLTERMQRFYGAIDYRETPQHYGHGDGVKEWWLNHGDCSEWVKFLDDDDSLHATCCKTMLSRAGMNVVAVLCQMLMVFSLKSGEAERSRIVTGDMAPNHVGTGCMLVQRDKARGITWPRNPYGDFLFLQELAKRGIVERVHMPLYNYNGYRDDRGRGYE